MTEKKKFILMKLVLILLLASMTLMNIAFLPEMEYADDSSSEIFENIRRVREATLSFGIDSI